MEKLVLKGKKQAAWPESHLERFKLKGVFKTEEAAKTEFDNLDKDSSTNGDGRVWFVRASYSMYNPSDKKIRGKFAVQ